MVVRKRSSLLGRDSLSQFPTVVGQRNEGSEMSPRMLLSWLPDRSTDQLHLKSARE
jgi:hypothetical protein